MSEEKRSAGDYEIIQAVQIGDCEIVVGENMADENDLPYMVAYYEYNAIMGRRRGSLTGLRRWLHSGW